jgi:hypothetical protein
VRRYRLANSRKINEHQISQLSLSELGDPNNGNITLHPHPLMILGVFAILWKFHDPLLLSII